MTPADRQLVEWVRARNVWAPGTEIAVGYLLAKGAGLEVSRKVATECEKTLAGLRVHRLQEYARP